MNLTIMGAGSWGTATAIHLARRGHSVKLWVLEADLARTMRKTGENTMYLPGFTLPRSIEPVTDIAEALEGAEIILLVVPSQFLRSVISKMAASYKGQPLVCMSKGIERGTHMLMSDVIAETLGEAVPLVVLSGPTFAREVAAGLPAAAVAASTEPNLAMLVQRAFSGTAFRLYSGADPVGAEVAGAMKNVIAVACGVVDGMGIGLNAAAALMTRGLHEITRLGLALGGMRETFYGLAGMGDLILTCTGSLSRNRTVGQRLGRGEKLPEILASMKMVAEGVATTESAEELAKIRNVDMPITRAMYDLLYEEVEPGDIVHSLMTRRLKPEDLL